MSFVEILLVGVSLSMDAFAVAVCKGLSMKKLDMRKGAVIALFFGVFQALMPVIGWLLGRQFESYIEGVDHWIAFGLLAFLGGRMIWESLRGEEESPGECSDRLDIKELFLLAVATSIDALAVGITLAFLDVPILSSAAIIGVTTFIISLAGVAIGNRFGTGLGKRSGVFGGAALILIGLKILLEHLGIIG